MQRCKKMGVCGCVCVCVCVCVYIITGNELAGLQQHLFFVDFISVMIAKKEKKGNELSGLHGHSKKHACVMSRGYLRHGTCVQKKSMDKYLIRMKKRQVYLRD